MLTTLPVQTARGITAKVPAPSLTPRGPVVGAPVSTQPYKPAVGSVAPPLQKSPSATAPKMTALGTPPAITPTLHTPAASPAPAVSTGGDLLGRAQQALQGHNPTTPAASSAPATPAPTAPAQPTYTTPAPITPAPAPTAAGAATSTLTGNEVPYSVLPQQSQGLQSLVGSMEGAAQNALANPTVYDDPLYQQITNSEKQNVNEDFNGQLSDLTSQLADRGINFSSIAGGKLNDLYTAKARALSDIDTNAAAQRANDLAAGRTSALSNAQGVAGLESGIESGNVSALQQERSYEDQLNEQARNEALQESLLPYQMSTDQENQFSQALAQALGYGTAPGATSLLGTAIGGFQNNSQLYGGMAQTANQSLSDSASLQAMLQQMGMGGGGDIASILALA